MKFNLITHCALCGQAFRLSAPLHANMSGTTHQHRLPCPCETRRPADKAPPSRDFLELTPQEQDEILSGRSMPAFGAIIDDNP